MTVARAQRAVVIDASVAIPFLRGDPEWAAFIGARIAGGDMLLAPSHFAVEVGNALLRGTTIKSADHVVDLMRALFATGIEEVGNRPLAIEDAIRLAARHQLSVYDAAYLGLAIDVDGELATLDKELLRAAEAEGVQIAGALHPAEEDDDRASAEDALGEYRRDGGEPADEWFGKLATERQSIELREQAEGERWAAAATDPEFGRETR